MAGKVTGMVLDHYHGDPIAKLVLLTLADRANEDALCWPSRGDICARSGASPATVTRKLRLLEREGWLARRQRYQTSVVFRINVPRLLLAAAVAERMRSIPKGFEPFPEERIAQAVEKSDNAHCEHENDHSEHKNDHLGDHLTVKKPSIEPKRGNGLVLTESQWKRFLDERLRDESRAAWLARCGDMPKVERVTYGRRAVLTRSEERV